MTPLNIRLDIILIIQESCMAYYIKAHGSVSSGPRSLRATPVSILTGRKKMQFLHLRSSVLP